MKCIPKSKEKDFYVSLLRLPHKKIKNKLIQSKLISIPTFHLLGNGESRLEFSEKIFDKYLLSYNMQGNIVLKDGSPVLVVTHMGSQLLDYIIYKVREKIG